MIYDIVDMTTWRTKTDILKELKSKGVEVSERGFRKLVESSKIMKALGENSNLKLSIKNGELIYTEY